MLRLVEGERGSDVVATDDRVRSPVLSPSTEVDFSFDSAHDAFSPHFFAETCFIAFVTFVADTNASDGRLLAPTGRTSFWSANTVGEVGNSVTSGVQVGTTGVVTETSGAPTGKYKHILFILKL